MDLQSIISTRDLCSQTPLPMNEDQINPLSINFSAAHLKSILIDLIYEYALRHIAKISTHFFLALTSLDESSYKRYHNRPDTLSFLRNKTLVQINNDLIKAKIFDKDNNNLEKRDLCDIALFKILSGYSFMEYFSYETGISKLLSYFPELSNLKNTPIERIQNLYRSFEVRDGVIYYQEEEINELWNKFLDSISDEDNQDLAMKLAQVESIDNNNVYLLSFLPSMPKNLPLSLISIKLSNVYHRIFPSVPNNSNVNYLTIPRDFLKRLTNFKTLGLEDNSLDKNSIANIEDLSKKMEKLSLSNNPSFLNISYKLPNVDDSHMNQLHWKNIDLSYTSLETVSVERNGTSETLSFLKFSNEFLDTDETINLKNTLVSGSTLYNEVDSLEELMLALSKIDIGENFLLDIKNILHQLRRYNFDKSIGKDEIGENYYPLLSRKEHRTVVDSVLLSDHIVDISDRKIYLFGLIDACESMDEVKKLLSNITIENEQYGQNCFKIFVHFMKPTFSSKGSSCSIL